MKKRTIIVLSFVLLIVAFLLVFIFNQSSCEPPEKPVTVPKSAVWKGGCDGGNWIELVSINDSGYRFRIYRDWDGTLEWDANFVDEKKDCSHISFDNWDALITGYLNGQIYTRDSLCHLEIIFPAYGGDQWETYREKYYHN